jgi:catalase
VGWQASPSKGRTVQTGRSPVNVFRLMSADQKRQLFDNIATAMQGAPEAIQLRQIAHLQRPTAYGRGVAERLGLVSKLPAAE